jgi:hypothetical protein
MWTAKSRSLFIAMSACLIAGCPASMPPSTGRTPPDASLVEPCPPLSPLADGTGAAVLRWILGTVDAYTDCQSRHRRLVEGDMGVAVPMPGQGG